MKIKYEKRQILSQAADLFMISK